MKVLVSFPRPTARTNPYIVQLGKALAATDGVTLVLFSFRQALLGRYDVFHAHWPEILVEGHSPLKRLARQILTTLFLIRLTFTRTPVVRTQHNVELPDGLSAIQQALLRWFDRLTVVRIRLNDTTEVDSRALCVTIPHGHYRDWFAKHPPRQQTPGRMSYFGLIRRYKGVEALASAFAGLNDDKLSLEIAGNPSSEELAAAIRAIVADDPRVQLHLAFLDDAELVDVVTRSALVVLPYRFMHNSGAVLTALSLDRPVLVPDTEVNRRLADEVGPGWIRRYTGDLTSDVLAQAIAWSAERESASSPDLSAREWSDAGPRHAQAYRLALDARRR